VVFPPHKRSIPPTKGHPWVGWIQNEEPFLLDGPADRNLALRYQPLKGLHPSPVKVPSQVGFRLPSKGPHPVSLPGWRKKWGPSAPLYTMGQRNADRLNGGLKPGKVSIGAKLHHTPTSGTAVTPQPQPLIKPIEKTKHPPMTPYLARLTPRTKLRLGPWILPAQRENLLDLYRHKHYQ
jgi:hypothetical protein